MSVYRTIGPLVSAMDNNQMVGRATDFTFHGQLCLEKKAV